MIDVNEYVGTIAGPKQLAIIRWCRALILSGLASSIITPKSALCPLTMLVCNRAGAFGRWDQAMQSTVLYPPAICPGFIIGSRERSNR